jgi:hypothetical protein
MDNKQLLTYAIMTVNDSNNRDYYDNFVPFVKEAIRISGHDIISANEVKVLIKSTFELDIPINVVNTILKKRLKPKGYIKYVEKKYIPNYDMLEESNFNSVRQKMLEKYDRLVSEIIDFAQKRYKKYVEVEVVESALERFIEKYQIDLLEKSWQKPQLEIEDKKDNDELNIIISSYVKECEDHYSVSFEFLIDIVKGTMLTNALYFNEELNSLQMKFKGTEIFLDSSFIIYSLGLAGKARQEPCTELLSMLRESNAILRVFRHNIDEIIGILEWCKNNLTSGHPDFHGTISHFLNSGYTPNDIERIIYSVEKEIEEKLRIKPVETVGFDEHKYVISEEELTRTLEKNMKYPRKNALERDVQSVAAIQRIRKDKKSFHVENCRAVFITTNYSLSHSVKEYFFNEEMPKLIPPVLHDSIITNLVWLKNPTKAPSLPTKRLVAECFAATSPKEHLWKRYIETVKIYENTNEITEKDIVLLRYTPGARELLVDKTLGDENAVTIGTVNEILAEIKSNQEAEKRAVEEQKQKEISYLKDTLTRSQKESAASLANRNLKLQGIAKKRAKIVSLLITILLSINIGVAIYLVQELSGYHLPNFIEIPVTVLFLIVPTLLGLFNINLIPVVKKINIFLERKIEASLKNKYL